MTVELLTRLQTTFYPLELEAIRQAGAVLVRLYHDVAIDLAERHGLPIRLRWKR